MKSVAAHDRPREKLQRLGAASLGDNELLAVVLGHGRANASALDLANAVLTGVGGSIGLARAGYDELAAHSRDRRRACRADRRRGRTGAAHADARRPRAHPDHVARGSWPRCCCRSIGSRAVEQFGVVLLDTKHRVLRTTRRDGRHARREHRPPARDLPRGGQRRRRGHRAVPQSSVGRSGAEPG